MSDEKKFYGLTESEFNQAKEAMRLACAPRDEDGNILTEEELEARDYKAYYPAVTPAAEGPTSPIIRAEEFAGGKSPKDFHHELGQMAPCGMYNGMALGPVVYDNPIYNMRLEQYHQFLQVKRYLDEQEKKEMETAAKKPTEIVGDQPALSVQIFQGNTPVSPIMKEARTPEVIIGDLQVYECERGMYIKLPDGDCSISNFTVRVLERRRVYARPDVYSDEYSVEVTYRGYQQTLTIRADSMSMVLKTIQKEIPGCTLASNIKSASKLIENAIRQQTIQAEEVAVIRCTGFIRIRGRWFYVHDNTIPPIPNVVFETGKSISCSIGKTPKQALLEAFQFLKISRKEEVILCLFLVAHLGPLFELFKEAGCLIRFVTVLVVPAEV